MSVAEVRSAVAAALNAMDGLRCNADGLVTESISPPEAMVDYRPVYHLTFGTQAPSVHEFIVRVYGSRSNARATQKQFDIWRDADNTDSVPYVLENDDGIAAVCHYLMVRECGPVDAIDMGRTQLLVIEFSCEVVF